MLTLAEQEELRPRLQQLTNGQLLALWDKLGLTIGKGTTRGEWLADDQEWLIGPLFADTERDELEDALNDVEATKPGRNG